MLQSPALWERDAALDAVDTLLAGARNGAGGALFLIAEAGVGKSAVLAEAFRRGADFRSGLGHGDGAEASLPYGILHQALGALDPHSPLVTFASDPAATDVRAALFYGVSRRLEEFATRPLLIGLDDLHRADADSLALLSVLCRRITTMPVAIVGTMRPFPSEAAGVALTLAGDGRARCERLQPLSAPATADLLLQRSGHDVAEAVVERAWHLTAGNPLLIEQAVAMLARDQELPEAADEATTTHELLVGRFAGVGDEALRFARAASVLGVRFSARVAADLAGLDDPAVELALESLARAGVIAAAAGSTAFVHPLFRSALYEDIAAPLRPHWHGRAFGLLRQAGASAEAADQARRSDLVGDSDAIEALCVAGRSAIRAGAGAAAERHLRAAVRLGGDAAAADVRIGLAEALLLTGNTGEAIAVAQAVIDANDLAAAATIAAWRVLGRAQFYAGALVASQRSYDAAVDASAPHDAATAAEVALEYAAVALFATGPAAAVPVALRARALLPPGSKLPVASAAALAHALSALIGGDASVVAGAAAAAATLTRTGAVDRAASLAFFGSMATMTEQFDVAEATLGVARAWADRGGDPVLISLIATASAIAALRCGRLGAAIDFAERAIALGDIGPAGVAWAASVASEVLLHLGRDAESLAAAARADGLAAERAEWLPLMWTRLTALQRDLAAGRADAAAASAAWLETTAARYGVVEPCFVPWVGEAMAAHGAVGNLAAVARLVDVTTAASTALACAWPAVAVARGRALLLERDGDASAAIELLTQTARGERVADLPLERIRVEIDLGRMLRRNGHAAEARTVLGDAHRGADAIGAAWLAGRAAEELRIAGGRRRRRGEADNLTAAEERVAALAAEGLSNAAIAAQLFVSAKTVDTHLQHIYAKLGINSRRDLMRHRSGGGASAT